MDAGELLQYGPTTEVFHRPQTLRVARAFSDPPMNLMAAEAVEGGVRVQGGEVWSLALPSDAPARLTLGLARNRIEEAGLLGRIEMRPVQDLEVVKIGPFDVEFIPVTHSVPHAHAIAAYARNTVRTTRRRKCSSSRVSDVSGDTRAPSSRA